MVQAIEGRTTVIGIQGENKARQIKFFVGDILAEFPGAVITLVHQRANDQAAYPVASTEIQGNFLVWTVSSGDTAQAGDGKCELIAMLNDVVVKTVTYGTRVHASLSNTATPPDPWTDWVEQVVEAAGEAEAAAALLASPTAEATTLEPGESATASYADGVFSFGIPRGEAGTPGSDGRDGRDGTDGADGFSPSASVSKSGSVATISITDKDGTTTAQISDGANGTNGQDGFSPSASVSKEGSTATITITDKTGTTTATVSDGASYTPVQWELIREDSQTNATEADIVINVDSNGNPFELTDIRLSFWTPVQDVQSAKGDYGRINFFNGETNLNSFYCGAWTQNAGTTAKICEGEIIQEGGMVETTFSKVQNDTVDAQILGTMRIGTTGARHFLLPDQPHVYTKVVITKVTGTGAYRLYGKRKVTA